MIFNGMTMTRAALLICPLLLLACGESNDEDPCGDLGSQPSGFDILAMDLNLLVDPNTYQTPTYVFAADYEEGQPVPFESVVFSLSATIEYLYSNSKSRGFFQFSLFPRAYACSPIPPSAIENLEEVSITSSVDFTDDYPAGASLNAFFDIVYMNSVWNHYELVSTDDGIVASYYSVADYMAQEDVQASSGIQLRLNSEPQNLSEHVFFINISLDSGEEFFLETPPIHFMN